MDVLETYASQEATRYCGPCKKEHPFTEEYWRPFKRTDRNNKIYYECRIVRSKKNKGHRKKNGPEFLKKLRIYHKSEKGRYNRLKTRSKERGLLVEISLEEYIDLVSSSCYYCDGKIPEVGYGLDRVDSSKGYLKDNCVACCTRCNRAKGDTTPTEFLEWAKQIVAHSSKEV